MSRAGYGSINGIELVTGEGGLKVPLTLLVVAIKATGSLWYQCKSTGKTIQAAFQISHSLEPQLRPGVDLLMHPGVCVCVSVPYTVFASICYMSMYLNTQPFILTTIRTDWRPSVRCNEFFLIILLIILFEYMKWTICKLGSIEFLLCHQVITNAWFI